MTLLLQRDTGCEGFEVIPKAVTGTFGAVGIGGLDDVCVDGVALADTAVVGGRDGGAQGGQGCDESSRESRELHVC